jgi:hypothetical protein
LLSTLAARKAFAVIRHYSRDKRGGGHVRGESAFLDPNHADAEGLTRILAREPTPDEAAVFAEGYERLVGKLTDETLRRVALLKLQGDSVEDIAWALHVSTRTVDRKLQLIRTVWEREGLV